MTTLTCLLGFLPNLGYSELLIIGVVAVLLFGNKLPEVARSMGKSFTEFKRGMNGVRDEWNDALYNEPQDTLDHDQREQPSENAFREPADQDEKSPTASP